MVQKRGQKLSASNQLALCSLLGTGYNPERCCDIFKDEYEIEMSPQNIRQNYLSHPKWKKIIKYMAERAQRRVLAHPLAKKINRLNILQDAINEAFTWRLDRINYDKEGRELSRVEKRNIGMVSNLVREARAEIEGDKALVDQSVHITHIHLSEKLKEARSRIDAILNSTGK